VSNADSLARITLGAAGQDFFIIELIISIVFATVNRRTLPVR